MLSWKIFMIHNWFETLELVWTPAMAASLSAQLSTMASDLYKEQMKGRIVDWDVPEQASSQQEMRDEPQVRGIYVRLFLKDPKFPLRNPKRFLEGLLDQYLSSMVKVLGKAKSPEEGLKDLEAFTKSLKATLL